MNLTHAITILLVGISAICYGDPIPHWSDLKKSGEGKLMIEIHEALLNYYSAEKKFPANLGELVATKRIAAAKLFITRADGSLECPRYFPGALNGRRVVLRIDPEKGDYTVLVRADGSIAGERKEESPNKAREDKREHRRP